MGHDTLTPRHETVARALRLEYFTVAWNLAEGLIAVLAALAARSVVLLGFGADSFVESASAAILIWRLRAERQARDRASIDLLDQRAHRLVGVSLLLLATYVALDAVSALWWREEPQPSLVGIALALASIGVMLWLARAKRRLAIDLGSRALEADSFQTTACFWLSLILLGGVTLNAAFGWWWADPLAALGMTYFLIREGIDAWRGEDCCSAC